MLWWAMLGSNQRPPRCQRGALPLRQSPSRRRRESNPRTGLCRPLPKPLGHSASANVPCGGIMALDIRRTVRAWGLRDGIRRLRADDGIRTRDPHLGKVMLYQLSHVRMWCTPIRARSPGQVCVQNCSRSWPASKLGTAARRHTTPLAQARPDGPRAGSRASGPLTETNAPVRRHAGFQGARRDRNSPGRQGLSRP